MILIDNQLLLVCACFLAGCLGVALIARRPAGHRAWRVADLLWVVLGLLGAVGAIVAGIYKADISRVERQIDIAYAATNSFDHDAARFRLRYCETPREAAVETLCDRAEFLSASTAENASLPLFLAVTERATPLKGLFFFGRDTEADMAGMTRMADAFDPGDLLTFPPLDDATRAALDSLQSTRPAIAGDYRILAQSYDMLLTQVRRLKTEWDYLQDRAWVLLVQIIALCLVSFAAPFRLGKAAVDLRGR